VLPLCYVLVVIVFDQLGISLTSRAQVGIRFQIRATIRWNVQFLLSL